MSDKRVLTLLLTDLVDSTKHLGNLGDARALEVVRRHDREARDLLARHRGREIDKSDGFLFTFEQPGDALRYTLAYHATLRRLTVELGVPLAARSGLHTGPVAIIVNRPEDVARGAKLVEVEGIAKPTAARLMTLASGGQTLLSPSTLALLDDEDTRDLRVVEHGHYRLKGIDEPLRVTEVGAQGVAPLRPPPDRPKVHRVVWTDHGWHPASAIAHNLPPEHTTFFGREAEQRAIADLFLDGARLVTLLGPGGTGKSHLARRFAATWLGDWPGGAWVCPLAEARSALDVARSVGRTLDIPLEQGDPFETVGEALAGRGPMLLIVDNLEQLVEVAPDTLGRWMTAAPRVAWLATTQQRLGLPGERLLPVDPLALPTAGGDPADSPAFQLFVDRARAANPQFAADADQAPHVARLVQLLDGLPLAIELAAARVRVLPPQRIVERIGQRFELLRGGGRGRPERLSTLRAAIDWSWSLLDPAEQAALAQASVFEGDFDLDAAEAVLAPIATEDRWPMDLVESLVDKSLVRSLTDDTGDVRFALFRSIQDYARDRLGETPQRDAAWRRHAAHYAAEGAPDRLAALAGPGGPTARRRLALALDNLAAAVRRGDPDDAALAALAALALLETSGPFGLALDLGETALAKGPDARLAARLRVALGVVATRAGQLDDARPLLVDALETGRAQGWPDVLARAQAALGHNALLAGRLDDAADRFRAARTAFRDQGDVAGQAQCERELAHAVGIRGGRLVEGRAHVDAALSLSERLGDLAGQAVGQGYLGALAAIQGDLGAGRTAYERARALAHEVGDRRTEGLAEGMIAGICVLTGEVDAARRHFDEALAIQRAIGDRVHEAMTAANLAELLIAEGERAPAADLLRRAAELARATGDPMTEGISLGTLGALLVELGEGDAGLARLARAEARLREAGDPNELAKLLCKAGRAALLLGRQNAAEERLRDARTVAASLDHGDDSELAQALSSLQAALASGR